MYFYIGFVFYKNGGNVENLPSYSKSAKTHLQSSERLKIFPQA